MKLFYSDASPFARKCRVVAMELGIDIDLAESHPFDNAAELLAANPLARVPCLVTDDGVSLVESDLICAYLNEMAGGDFIPQGAAKWPVLRLQAMADGLMDLTVARRIEMVREDAQIAQGWIERREAGIARAVEALAVEADTFAGARHIGSLAVAVALAYLDFRYPQFHWRKHEALMHHLTDWMKVESFVVTSPQPSS